MEHDRPITSLARNSIGFTPSLDDRAIWSEALLAGPEADAALAQLGARLEPEGCREILLMLEPASKLITDTAALPVILIKTVGSVFSFIC